MGAKCHKFNLSNILIILLICEKWRTLASEIESCHIPEWDSGEVFIIISNRFHRCLHSDSRGSSFSHYKITGKKGQSTERLKVSTVYLLEWHFEIGFSCWGPWWKLHQAATLFQETLQHHQQVPPISKTAPSELIFGLCISPTLMIWRYPRILSAVKTKFKLLCKVGLAWKKSPFARRK